MKNRRNKKKDYRRSVIEFIKGEVERLQDPKRFGHTLRVLSEAEYFCNALGIKGDEQYAIRRASLFHDVTKCFSGEQQAELCQRYGIDRPISPTIHQDTGACYILEKYPDIVDESVVSAVKKHTTGDENMSVCDMVVFISDFTEAGRKYKDCLEMREYIHAECGKIDKKDRCAVNMLLCDAVEKICEMSLSHIVGDMDDRTVRTRDAMRRILKENGRG